MITFNFDEPSTRAGYCPECSSDADIWCSRDGVWNCNYCNWSGSKPTYEISETDKQRLEYLKRMEYSRDTP